MEKNNYSAYGSFGFEKINSPKPKKNGEPKANKTVGKSDLRGGKK